MIEIRKVILASHATLAKGLKETAEMIVGDLASAIQVYELKPGGHADEFVEELKVIVEEDVESEYVILCDIYGASVCTAMVALLAYENVKLFSVMNLNLLLSVLIEYPEKLTDIDVQQIVLDAQTGIKNIQLVESEEEDF